MSVFNRKKVCPKCRKINCDCFKSERKRYKDNRPSAAQRGYDGEWRKIREEVLRRAGIPRHRWEYYDVDHRPAYNKEIEPDHWKYQLVPMLHGEHSKKTNKEDGGGWK